ncbi:MAG: hypothetical protein GWO20_13655 [Candidatus Korarchaeota archaeon]|nr:hypothetical protein [Candidatus Korarchaeota archaeon]NIU85564.1 hypothetical protein [Candidatus Thorarchaeota archaeon]NIW15672.1 hypothetical protein [Candidatus Thorarchaeota archaeon]NIW52611.1 hypothetical protein [Candidatus Korarchaeota archaeon]
MKKEKKLNEKISNLPIPPEPVEQKEKAEVYWMLDKELPKHIKEHWEEHLGPRTYHMIEHSLSGVKEKIEQWGECELTWIEVIAALKKRMKKNFPRK